MTQSRVRIIDPPEARLTPRPHWVAVWPPETLHPHIIARSFTKKQISVRREKALCFSGCDSRPASKHVPAGRNRSGQWR